MTQDKSQGHSKANALFHRGIAVNLRPLCIR